MKLCGHGMEAICGVVMWDTVIMLAELHLGVDLGHQELDGDNTLRGIGCCNHPTHHIGELKHRARGVVIHPIKHGHPSHGLNTW